MVEMTERSSIVDIEGIASIMTKRKQARLKKDGDQNIVL